MFKLCLVLVAVLGLSAGVAVPVARNEPGALDIVLGEFLALTDPDLIAVILLGSLFDPEFQVAMQFVFSPEFAELYLEIADKESTKEFIVFLEENGLNVQAITGPLREFLLLPPPPGRVAPRQGRSGILGIIEQFSSAVNTEELIALADYHVENTPEFAALYERVQSPAFGAEVRELQNHPTVDRMGQWLISVGVDVNNLIDTINEALGWGLVPI